MVARPGRSIAWRAATLVPRIVLMLTLACALIPFSPQMPQDGLDPSWMAATNQAVAQELQFGRDAIFPYGPYASVVTRTYHPATDAMMMWGALHVVVAFSVALLVLSAGSSGVVLLGFAFAAGAMTYLRDTLFLLYPVLVVLCCHRQFEVSPCKPQAGGAARLWLLALLCSPFGLLPLVKGSMLISCGVVTGVLVLRFVLERQWRAACVIVAVPAAWLVLYWALAGQPIGGLPAYFQSILPIISGYTAAMSSKGIPSEPIAYLIGAVWLLTVIWFEAEARGLRRLVLLATFALTLFLAFKAAFVRHDGHALIAGSFLLLAALSLNLIYRSLRAVSLLVVATCVWALIDSHYLKTGLMTSVGTLRSAATSAWSGLERRVSADGALRAEFEASLATIRDANPLLPLEGRADIYSFNQSVLLASGARWSPRPVFQSYSAYTPDLAEKNRRHLLSGAAPDSIVFRVEPIDGRVPSSEDGASWPLLLSAYRPVTLKGDTLYLKRRADAALSPEAAAVPAVPADVPLSATLGDPVAIPAGPGPIFARIDVQPTLLGRIAGLVYKPSELRLGVRLEDGRTLTFRFVAGFGPSGFVVSPLVETVSEFTLLYGGQSYLSPKKVESFWITAERPGRFWSSRYTVSFERLDLGPPTDIRGIAGLDQFVSLDATKWSGVAPGCDGNIDLVNGVAPGAGALGSDALLSVAGWLALSTKTGDLPDRVLLVLTDLSGTRSFVEPRRTRRVDLGTHFAVREMVDAGFEATFDVSRLQGRFTLALAYEDAGSLRMCPQFSVPLTLRGGA
jgi:hypothetical protein